MTIQKISLNEALKLLADNKLGSNYSVGFLASDRIEATDAIKLGAIGIDVPEENIYYDDDHIADDDDFNGEWIPIDSDISHLRRDNQRLL
jgi:hypothetical protein